MLEARIASPRGSLYFAAEATPYDLEMLQLYVRDLAPEKSVGALSLEVRIDEADPAAPEITSWLAQLAATGVQVARTRRALAR
jgi:hypothetical protein